MGRAAYSESGLARESRFPPGPGPLTPGPIQTAFDALAETYDPLTLTKWGTYGTRGDANKAQDLYAKADAAGIQEAKARLQA